MKTKYIIAVVALAIVLATGALFALLSAGVIGIGTPGTPEEITQLYVNDKIDSLSEAIAGIILFPAPWFVKELGAEFIEDRIHGIIKWDYAPAYALDPPYYEVEAKAYVNFNLNLALTSGSITASVPFTSTVDMDRRQVVSFKPQSPDLDFDFPGADSLENAREAASQKIDEATQKIDEVTQSVTDAKDQAQMAIDQGDCVGAAKALNLPDSFIATLEKPKSERGLIEKKALGAALAAAGLSEACSDLAE